MNIILGGHSQLSNYLSLKIRNSIKIFREECDITKSNQVENIIKKYRPSFVFNCAAYHNTLKCEKNPKKAFLINAFSLRHLAYLSNLYNFKIIHFSSDYVFDGLKSSPYHEGDYPNPINIYGQSKLLGEFFLKQISKNYLIYRISSIYSHFPCRAKKGLNFVDTILKLSKELDELNVNSLCISPTYVGDLASQVRETYKYIKNQVVHCVSEGSTTWYDFAKLILLKNEIKIKVNKIKSLDDNAINRPKYSVLENRYLINNNLSIMPNWKKGFENYLKDLDQKKTNH